MAVLGNKDSTTRLEDVRSYAKGDKNYFSILNRPLEDLAQRDLDIRLIHTPARGIRVRATNTASAQVVVDPGNYLFAGAVQQYAGATLSAVTAASAGNKRIDLIYFRIDTGTAVRTPSAESATYGGVTKPILPAGLDTIPLAYIYVGETGPVFQDGLAVNTDGAIEDIRPAPGASQGRQLETVGSNFLADVSGGAAGSSELIARADHRHRLNVDATVPQALTPGNVGAAGVAGTYALIDHVHLIPTETNPAAFLSDLSGGSAGAGATFARADHRHTVNVGTTIPGADTGSGSAGASTVYARDDHFHPLNVTGSDPATLDPSVAATPGVSTFYSRHDHVHDMTGVVEGKMVFGRVASGGSIQVVGSGGWSSVRNSVGNYTVTLTPALSSSPTVVGSCIGGVIARNFQATNISSSSFDVLTSAPGTGPTDDAFSFMVMVP